MQTGPTWKFLMASAMRLPSSLMVGGLSMSHCATNGKYKNISTPMLVDLSGAL